MTQIIADANQGKLEEVIDTFMNEYLWFQRRLSNVDQEHRDAVGILLETHPHIMLHLKTIFDRNLNETGFDKKYDNKWYLTHEEYVLMGMLGIPNDEDDIIIHDYKEGSGIISLRGEEYDSTLKPSDKAQ